MSFTIGRFNLGDGGITSHTDSDGADANRTVRFSGLAYDSALLADSKAIRVQIPSLVGQVVPIVWTIDPDFDGFYFIEEASADGSVQAGSYQNTGLFGLEVTAVYVGSEADVEFQSKLIGDVLDNDKGIDNTEDDPFVGLPVNAESWRFESTAPTSQTRASEDGNVTLVRQVARTVGVANWSIGPGDYYKGASRVSLDGNIVQGLYAGVPSSYLQITNGLVKVTWGLSSTLTVEHWDGALWDSVSYTTSAGTFERGSILRNDPEAVTIRLVSGSTAGAVQQLDLTLRRGSYIVSGVLKSNTSTTLYAETVTDYVWVTVTPTGATSAVGMQTNANVDGNRPVLGTANGVVDNTTDERIELSSATVLDFFIGSEVNYAASAGDTAADLCLQYLGHISEKVTVVRR